MMQAVMGAIRGAFSRIFSRNFSRIRGRLFLSQWAGNFLLMLLAAGWLQIPDSHTWQFAFSMLSGVLLVVGFLWLYVATFRYLRRSELDIEEILQSPLISAVISARGNECPANPTRHLQVANTMLISDEQHSSTDFPVITSPAGLRR